MSSSEQLLLNITVTRATLDEKPILRNLLELYEHDFTEYEPKVIGPHGLYGYKYLDHYWTEPNRHPYLIRVDGQLAGFVLLNRHTVSGGDDRWTIAEFHIMRMYRGKGVGEFAARAVFDLWPGKWEVSQTPNNAPSHEFWRKVISRYTQGSFVEIEPVAGSDHGPVQHFDNSIHFHTASKRLSK